VNDFTQEQDSLNMELTALQFQNSMRALYNTVLESLDKIYELEPSQMVSIFKQFEPIQMAIN
jgi:hypothetical protein